MSTTIKSIAGRGLNFLLGVVFLLASVFVFMVTFAGDTKRTYSDRKTEKSLLYAGVILGICSLGSFSFAFTKKKKWKEENEAIKLTGNKINKNPEVSVKIENFKIEPLTANSDYKCIRTSIAYRGEQKDLTVYLANEADYDKIAHAKEINVSGEFRDEVWSLAINNAKLNIETSSIIT